MIIMSIKDKITKLIDVKSIMTLTLTMVFCYLSIRRYINTDQFLTIYSVIISFFFGVKIGQKNDQDRPQ